MLSEKQKERLREQRKAAYAKMKAAQKSDPIYQAKQAAAKKRSKDYYLLQKTKKKTQLKAQQMIDRQAKIDEIAQSLAHLLVLADPEAVRVHAFRQRHFHRHTLDTRAQLDSLTARVVQHELGVVWIHDGRAMRQQDHVTLDRSRNLEVPLTACRCVLT